MPSIVQEALSLGESALFVAAVAVPVGLACALVARRLGEPVLPSGRGFSRWLNADVAMLALVCLLLKDVLAAMTGPSIDADWPEHERFRMHYEHATIVGLALAPLLLVGFQNWKRSFAKEPLRRDGPRFVADIAAGVVGWLIVVPPTFAVHFVANAILDALAIPPDDHPLKHLKLETFGQRALFVIGACAIAPIFEEMGFRRVMVPWAARKPLRSGIVLVFAALVALPYTWSDSRWGPIAVVLAGSALALATLLIAKWRPGFPVGSAMAVLSTATLFAVAHSRVWPTPIPLFVLGIGLGWLVLRTKSATAAIVAHGLFNAISAVNMLRGGP